MRFRSVVLATAVLGTPAMAQTATPAGTPAASGLQEIAVTAQRREENPQKAALRPPRTYGVRASVRF